jgi:hypothetical protein
MPPGWPVEWRPNVTIADEPDPPGTVPPLPPREPPRCPGEHLVRRRAPMPYTCATSPHPGGFLIRRGAYTAVVLRSNAPTGALWLDSDGLWRAASGAATALAVSGEPDGEALEALERRAPSFRHFAEARDWMLDVLGGGGEVIQLAGRRAGPRHR